MILGGFASVPCGTNSSYGAIQLSESSFINPIELSSFGLNNTGSQKSFPDVSLMQCSICTNIHDPAKTLLMVLDTCTNKVLSACSPVCHNHIQSLIANRETTPMLQPSSSVLLAQPTYIDASPIMFSSLPDDTLYIPTQTSTNSDCLISQSHHTSLASDTSSMANSEVNTSAIPYKESSQIDSDCVALCQNIEPKVLVVVDTNALLGSPNMWDLHSFLPNLMFIVPYVVIQELDGLKKDSSIGVEARSALYKLHKTMVVNREGWVRGQQVEQVSNIREIYGNKGNNDDIILDCVFYFRKMEREQNTSIILLTADKGLQIKASFNGIAAASPYQAISLLKDRTSILDAKLFKGNLERAAHDRSSSAMHSYTVPISTTSNINLYT